MKKVLVNISNHHSKNWSDRQKEGWDKIIDIPFPQIPANINEREFAEIVREYFIQFFDIYIKEKEQAEEIYCMLQGEFTFCYSLFERLRENGINFAIPFSERKVEETIDSEGKVEKKSVFEFVKWIIICGEEVEEILFK